jgi:hypothetical protein
VVPYEMHVVTRAVTSRHMEQIQEHPTARLTAFVEPTLADQIERAARSNERSISAEVRLILKQALEAKRG